MVDHGDRGDHAAHLAGRVRPARKGAFATFLAAGGHATAAQGAAVGICITVQTLALGVIGVPFYLTVRAGRRNAVPRSIGAETAMEAA